MKYEMISNEAWLLSRSAELTGKPTATETLVERSKTLVYPIALPAIDSRIYSDFLATHALIRREAETERVVSVNEMRHTLRLNILGKQNDR